MPKINQLKIFIIFLALNFQLICNAGDAPKNKVSLKWGGKECSVPIENISEADALKYTSLAASMDVAKDLAKSESGPRTLETRYSGRCPRLIERRQDRLYYWLGMSNIRYAIFVFEIKADSLVFESVESPCAKANLW